MPDLPASVGLAIAEAIGWYFAVLWSVTAAFWGAGRLMERIFGYGQ